MHVFFAFTNELEKIAQGGGSAVMSTLDLMAQESAHRDLQELLNSQSSKAYPAAVVKGMAVGAVLPAVMSVAPWVLNFKARGNEMATIVQQAHIAKVIEKEMPDLGAKGAKDMAAAVHTFVNTGTPHWKDPKVIKAVRQLRLRVGDPGLGLELLTAHGAPVPAELSAEQARAFISRVKVRAGNLPTKQVWEKILAEGQTLAGRGTKHEAARAFGTMALRRLPTIAKSLAPGALVGAIYGAGRVKAQRERAQRVSALRRRA